MNRTGNLKKFLLTAISLILIFGMVQSFMVNAEEKKASDGVKALIIDFDGVITQNGMSFYNYDGKWHEHTGKVAKGDKIDETRWDFDEFTEELSDEKLDEYVAKVTEKTGVSFKGLNTRKEKANIANAYFAIKLQHSDLIETIKDILDKADAKLVVVSGWRGYSDKKELFLSKVMEVWGLEDYYYGYAPDFYQVSDKAKQTAAEMGAVEKVDDSSPREAKRAAEVWEYLYTHKEVENFVTLDDLPIKGYIGTHAITTINLNGITVSQADEAVNMLNDKTMYGDWPGYVKGEAQTEKKGGLVNRLVDFFVGFPKWLAIIIISMVPLVELRGGILAAAIMKVPFLYAFPLCILGNIILMPFILFFLNKIFAFMRRFKLFDKFLSFLDRKVEKNREKVEKGEFIGLLLFVGIPLPGTGAWTGALIANAIGMPIKRSLPAICLGVLLAGVIMSVLCYGAPGLFSMMIGA